MSSSEILDRGQGSSSVSSRSFRERLLTASIMSVFRTDSKKIAPASSSPSRPTSTVETISTMTGGEKGKQVEDKDHNIAYVKSNATTIDTHGQGNDGLSSASSPKEGDTRPFNGKSDPFAGGASDGVQYQSMAWWQAGMVMVAETISLGILSLPLALSDLGIIAGLVMLIWLGIMASYSGYVIGQLRIVYPHIHSMADAGEVLFGRVGGEIIGAGQLLFYIFIMGSHLLTFSVMMNAITNHGACTIIFMVAGTVLSLLFTLPRTCQNLSYYSVASFISIVGAVVITMIGVGIDRSSFHFDQATGLVLHDIRLWPRPDISFHKAFLAVANMVFAYAGHVAFFTFISELRRPADFPKALAFLQISDISMYIVTAVVVYYYAGNNVASPALDSASPLVRKIAYGVAIPTIVIAGVVNGHVAVKYLYVRILRNDKDDTMHKRTPKAIGIWIAICTSLWVVAWIIAEGIPVFNDLLGITSALFASWFTFGLSGMFWFHLNFRWVTQQRTRSDVTNERKTWMIRPIEGWTLKKGLLLVINIVNILLGASICVIGLYASGMSIAGNSETKKPFSCADNSGFRG